MNKIFDNVPFANLPRTAFDLSHEVKTTIGMGKLYPVFLKEVVPGDKWNINTQHIIRFPPLVSPVMHRINAYIHYFYVPNNILDENWETLISEGGNYSEEIDVPYKEVHKVVKGTLADYLGLPIFDNTSHDHIQISEYPFRAFASIWNEYYRDQNYQSPIDWTDSGLWATQLTNWLEDPSAIPIRAWAKDYFTSALPYAQKGEPGIANIDRLGDQIQKTSGGDPGNNPVVSVGDGSLTVGVDPVTLLPNLHIDINEIRRANAMQRYIEKIYRVGSRYIEYLKGVWGVQSDDLTLKRPQYIGGGKTPVVVSEVLSTAETIDSTDSILNPVGSMKGHAISVGSQNQASVYCKYHGYIIGVMSIMPDPAYMQGLDRMWTRYNNMDFYTPDFANLGEQEILNQELFINEDTSDNQGTFGYQQRYAEYKYAQNIVTGEFRDTLDFWHLARKFASKPVLESSFIRCVPDTRIFAVENPDPLLYVTLWHNVVAVRPMPLQPIPGL